MSVRGRSRWSSPEIQAAISSAPNRESYRLYAAFMYRKVRDYVLYRNSRNKGMRELAELARSWIFDVGEAAKVWRDSLLSFEDVCDILDLPPPAEMRDRIQKLRRKDLLRREKAHKEGKPIEDDDSDLS